MKRTIVFRKAAQRDFDKSYDWYESQKAGLGDEFAQRVQDELDVLTKNPKSTRKCTRKLAAPL